MPRTAVRIAIVFAVVLFTLSLHYMILPMPPGLHRLLHETDLHRRLCYIPIILGALWFGLRGGLLTAAAISAAVLPLAVRFQGSLATNADFIEILFYFAIGALAGTLVDSKDRERSKKERLEQDLASAERMAALGRASAGIAHEVRTPLGSIQGAAEILAEDYPSGHVRRPFFDILVEECRRLGRVVDDFLDLSRPITLKRSPTPIGPLVEGAAGAVRGPAEHNRVQVRVSTQGADRMLSLDAHRMHQALVNLLRNAIQASPDGGDVFMTVHLEPDTAVFEVADEGPGIPSDDLERIFEPFFTRRRDGTGLGLPLARQVAAGHGGWLTAANRSGGGAVFTLRIPLAIEGGKR